MPLLYHTGEQVVAKKQDRKPRAEYIYGTTKGVVKQLEFTVDQGTGEISFGKDTTNVYSETTYGRPKGPKVLSRVPQAGEDLTFSTDAALKKNYDFLCAVDTNTRTIRGKDVSVVGVVIVTPTPVTGGTFWNFDVPFCLEYIGLKAPQENFGWLTAWEYLVQAGMIKPGMRIGMVVDSDLGNINRYNQRKKPVLQSFPLPENMHLVYASCDAGKENVVNKALAAADSISAPTLRAIDTGVAPFNEERLESPWFEGFRKVTPRKITRT
jgi:hypothetical protein